MLCHRRPFARRRWCAMKGKSHVYGPALRQSERPRIAERRRNAGNPATSGERDVKKHMSDKPGESSFDYWRYFAGEARRTGALLYERLAEGVASNAELRAFASGVREGQPAANLLFGAVHYLLLRGAEHPLRRYYPNLNGGVRVEGEDPFPHFQDFVVRHREELAPLIATRVTNTNEVGRSALLHAGFREIARASGEPLNLIEI